MLQFNVDDIVMYGVNGCCRVDAIEKRDAGDYYILKPVHNDRTKFLVPLENDELVSRMRRVPSKRTLRSYIKRAADEPTSWIDDNSERREAAKRVIADGTELEMLVLVRSFYKHKQAVLAAGKKATSSDNSILKTAQEHIRDEFSVVLDIDPEDVDAYIEKAMAK